MKKIGGIVAAIFILISVLMPSSAKAVTAAEFALAGLVILGPIIVATTPAATTPAAEHLP